MTEQPNQHSIPQWTLGDRLRKSLEHADMTVQDMAEYLETSRNTVGNYIAGRTRVPGVVMRAWAMRTDVPRLWLETGVSPHAPEPPKRVPDQLPALAELTERKRARARARGGAVSDSDTRQYVACALVA